MRGHRLRVALAWLVSLAVASGGGWWAASATLRNPAAEAAISVPPTVEVVEGSLGRSITLPALASWRQTPLASAGAGGIVTATFVKNGAMVDAGASLLEVNQRPIVVAQGDGPSFRDLTVGAVGRDVRQLQGLLAALGFFRGEATGTMGPQTLWAVKQWQRSLGIEPTGEVLAGDVVYVPTLPVRTALAPGVRTGAHVAPGAELIQRVSESPSFTMPLEDDQAAMLSEGTAITLTHGEHTWKSMLSELRKDPQSGKTVAELAAVGKGGICGKDCAAVPLGAGGKATVIQAEAILVPAATGAQVPRSAIVTDASGATFVVAPDGQRIPVTVTVAADGQAIVSGVDIGQRVLIAPAA